MVRSSSIALKFIEVRRTTKGLLPCYSSCYCRRQPVWFWSWYQVVLSCGSLQPYATCTVVPGTCQGTIRKPRSRRTAWYNGIRVQFSSRPTTVQPTYVAHAAHPPFAAITDELLQMAMDTHFQRRLPTVLSTPVLSPYTHPTGRDSSTFHN